MQFVVVWGWTHNRWNPRPGHWPILWVWVSSLIGCLAGYSARQSAHHQSKEQTQNFGLYELLHSLLPMGFWDLGLSHNRSSIKDRCSVSAVYVIQNLQKNLARWYQNPLLNSTGWPVSNFRKRQNFLPHFRVETGSWTHSACPRNVIPAGKTVGM